MTWLVWLGAAVAVLSGFGLIVLALRARTLSRDESPPEAVRSAMVTLAALNGAVLGMAALGIGLMVVGVILQ